MPEDRIDYEKQQNRRSVMNRFMDLNQGHQCLIAVALFSKMECQTEHLTRQEIWGKIADTVKIYEEMERAQKPLPFESHTEIVKRILNEGTKKSVDKVRVEP